MAAALPFIGAGIGAIGSLRQGAAQRNAYEMEAAAKRAQAAQVDIAAARDIDLTQQRLERTLGAQKVAFGKSGVSVSSGSALLEMENTAAIAMDEISAIRGAAAYKKGTLMTEAGLSEYLGGEAETASYFGAARSILDGFSKNPYVMDAPRKGNL